MCSISWQSQISPHLQPLPVPEGRMPVLLVFLLLPLPDGFRKGKQGLKNQSLDNLSFSTAQLKFFKLLLEFLCLLFQSRLKGTKWIHRCCPRPW